MLSSELGASGFATVNLPEDEGISSTDNDSEERRSLKTGVSLCCTTSMDGGGMRLMGSGDLDNREELRLADSNGMGLVGVALGLGS